MAERIHLAANNPDLGGGEQMLLRHAEALLSLGHPVTVAAPDSSTEVLDAARAVRADVAAIRADGRRDYLRGLRAWDRNHRSGLLWCHGLVPALATAGHPDRIVHLHQDPRGAAQRAASHVARRGALLTLVPSHDMSLRISGSRAHPNWTAELPLRARAQAHAVGYLGRLSPDKGVDVLARAMVGVDASSQLIVAGDDRHVSRPDRAVVAVAMDALGDRLRLIGHVPPADLFSQIRLVVFPSVWSEPFGLVVAEAMASGVPFVISDAGALPEVAGSDHPWIARRGDDNDLARVITEALAASEDTMQQLTERSRVRWESEYSPRAGQQRVRDLLDELGIG